MSRTFYARGQTGQQLLLGAYQAMSRQIDAGRITMLPRREMLDLVVVDGRARGIVVRSILASLRITVLHRISSLWDFHGEKDALALGAPFSIAFTSRASMTSN